MTETDRTYEYDTFLISGLDLEPIDDEESEGSSRADERSVVIPVNYSLDVIQRLIERLQEL